MRLSEIKPYKKNAKKHDETQIKNVMQSIKEFGVVQPIVVDRNNTIIIGHCRYEAMKRLGYDELQDDWVKVVDLSDEEAEKLRLLDNKLNESEWDLELLKDLVPSIDFSDFEVDWNLGEKKEKEGKDKDKGEVPFAEILGEENNYIVLKFNNTVDWLQIESLFGLENRQAYSTRTDGKIGKNMKRIGVGRVVDGAEFLNKIGVDL